MSKTVKCIAIVKHGRINLLIRKKEVGYGLVSNVLAAIRNKGFVSWYGDVEDENGNEQCGLILTSEPKEGKELDND